MYLISLFLLVVLTICIFTLKKQINELLDLHEIYSDDFYRYRKICFMLSEIETITSFIASSECTHRRREAEKILKIMKRIKDIEENIIHA